MSDYRFNRFNVYLSFVLLICIMSGCNYLCDNDMDNEKDVNKNSPVYRSIVRIDSYNLTKYYLYSIGCCYIPVEWLKEGERGSCFESIEELAFHVVIMYDNISLIQGDNIIDPYCEVKKLTDSEIECMKIIFETHGKYIPVYGGNYIYENCNDNTEQLWYSELLVQPIINNHPVMAGVN